MGVRLLAEAGYDPMAMSETWEQLIGELDLSAPNIAASSATATSRCSRPTRRRNRGWPISRFRRPRSGSRAGPTTPTATAISRRSAPIRPTLLDDQVKLNDPGASQYVIDTLAKDGWNGLLRFHEGEIWRLRNRTGRRCPRGAGLCRGDPLSRCAAGRLALARDHADEAGPDAPRRAPPLPAICRWRPMRPTRALVRQMMAG